MRVASDPHGPIDSVTEAFTGSHSSVRSLLSSLPLYTRTPPGVRVHAHARAHTRTRIEPGSTPQETLAVQTRQQ